MKRSAKTKQLLLWGIFALVFLSFVSPAFAGRTEKCELFGEIKDYEGCWTCTIFLLFFDASNALAGYVGTILEGPAKQVLGIFFGIWLAFNTTSFLGRIGGEPDLSEFATKVGGMFFRVVFALVFLSAGSSFIFDYFINPVVTSASLLSVSLVTQPTACSGEGSMIPASSGAQPMSAEVRQALDCMTGALGEGLREAQKMAYSLRCGSFYWKEFSIPFLGDVSLFNPLMWFWGCIMGSMFWGISLIFPMTLMDAIFRMGLMVSLVPMWVVAWVFPATRQYAKVAWDILFHSCLLFVVMALVMNMAVAMIQNSLTRIEPSFMNLMRQGAYVDAYDKLDEAGGVASFLIVVAVCFFGILITPKAEEMTQQISGQQFPESCGMKALEYIFDLLVTLLLLVITLLTLGAGGIAILAKAAHGACKTAEAAKRIMELMKQAQKRLRQMKQMADRVKNAAKGAGK